jgi:hypothetical protein
MGHNSIPESTGAFLVVFVSMQKDSRKETQMLQARLDQLQVFLLLPVFIYPIFLTVYSCVCQHRWEEVI